MLLGNVPTLPFLDYKGVSNCNYFVDCKLTEAPLAVLVACQALPALDLLDLFAEQLRPLDDFACGDSRPQKLQWQDGNLCGISQC